MSEKRIMDPDVLLQQELDAMAREVPDMPASFRKGWREAVRADALNRAEAAGQAPETAERRSARRTPEAARTQAETAERRSARRTPETSRMQAETAEARSAGAERPAAGRLIRSRRWVGWVCAAAAMVFLVGGTMLTRNTLSPRLRAAPAATSAPGNGRIKAPGTELTEETPEAEEAAPEGDALTLVSSGSLRPAAFIGMNSEEDAPVEDTWQADENLQLLVATANPTSSPDQGTMEGTFEAETADEDAEIAPVSASLDTEKREEAPDLGTRIRDFLEDMGAFVMAALPYLAGAAVLIAVILLVRKKMH